MQAAGWPNWWRALGIISLGMAAALWLSLSTTLDVSVGVGAGAVTTGGPGRVRRTLTAAGPWLAALTFGCYSAQWLAVIGFLPSVYTQAGLADVVAGSATALAAAVNIVGNVGAGRLLQRGVPAHRILETGFLAMALGAFVAFAPLLSGSPWAGAMKYGAVLVFSACGGLIPATLFTLAVRLAPDEGTVSTTVGWMQQWSSAGQFAGPPLVAALAVATGGWQWSWLVTGSCAMAGLFLARSLRVLLRAGTLR
jgi:cyanate permease